MPIPLGKYMPRDHTWSDWLDRLKWTLQQPDALAAFSRATGVICSTTSSTGPLVRLLDDITGGDPAIAEDLFTWFNAYIWGEPVEIEDAMMTQAKKRHACAHCGENALLLCLFEADSQENPRIHCMQCGSMGPAGDTVTACVIFWNQSQQNQLGCPSLCTHFY